MFLFYVCFSKNELNMNAQVGYASGKVKKNSEKHIYFN